MHYRELDGAMGRAVAERSILRTNRLNIWESWGDVATRVAFGNVSLMGTVDAEEFDGLRRHIANGTILMSGRSLQHGDGAQALRPQEVFTNCSVSVTSSMLYYLLLNGSGVGRLYDDALMLADWDTCPDFVCVLSRDHADYREGIPTPEQYQDCTHVFQVPDSREGWAQAVELLETAAAGIWKLEGKGPLVLDFSLVRPNGSPIGGMQGRPASGPVPFMEALNNIKKVMGQGWKPWKQAMFVDHYLSECVLVGGARRAARIAMKSWFEKDILEFITIKRDNPGSLWSSNNSIMADAEFWSAADTPGTDANLVFATAVTAAFFDGTGEPGFVNYDKLPANNEGMEILEEDNAFASKRHSLSPDGAKLLKQILTIAKDYKVSRIVNPCSEVQLAVWGGFCVIGDLAPVNADSLEDAKDAVRVLTRALIRLNTMDSIYNGEVRRTNRIGVSLTGIHEAAYKWFGFGFRDLLDESISQDWWDFVEDTSDAACEEAESYANKLGVTVPHSVLTIKPAGCASLDTTIFTSDGVKTMRELFSENGVDLNTPPADGTWLEPITQVYVKDKDNNFKPVTKLYVNGVKPVFEISFEDGHSAKLTGNHKLLTPRGWIRVDALCEGDEVLSF